MTDTQATPRSRTSWPILRLVIASAALGAATTVGVAWTLAWLEPIGAVVLRRDLLVARRAGEKELMQFEQCASLGAQRQAWRLDSAIGPLPPVRLGDPETAPPTIEEGTPEVDEFIPAWGDAARARAGGSPVPDFGCEDARGWPALALWCSIVETQAPNPADPTVTEPRILPRGGIALYSTREPRWWRSGAIRALPLRPIWTGLALDSLAFGAAWLAALWGAATARSAIRRSRGRCGACGYDLHTSESAVCPECGTPVTSA